MSGFACGSIEARITPWLAWLERVDELVYYSRTA
jgi:hypothetical protein